MKIAVFGTRNHPVVLSLIKNLLNHFTGSGNEFVFETALLDYLVSQNVRLESCRCLDADFDAELAISFGGDGSFLKAASYVGKKEIPIIGVNTGRLGFLTDLPGDDVDFIFQLIENQNYEIEERSVIEVKTSDGATLAMQPFAINETAIMKQDSSAMLDIRAVVNGELINNYRADGLIIATPTGSTAYSMSVGGPLVVPSAENFVLAPIASHSLTVRPLVIPDSWEIELSIDSRSHSYLVAIDGRSQILDCRTKLTVRKADYKLRLAKRPGRTFFDMLKEKLMWGLDSRN